MKLSVEFLGLARSLAQAPKTLIEIDDQASFRSVLQQLATQFPALYGPVIQRESFALAPSYMLNINGVRPVSDLDAPAAGVQRLLLMFLEAGG